MTDSPAPPSVSPVTAVDRTQIFGAREAGDVIRCDACPVLCRIRPGKTGACDRYGNVDGRLVRTDPLVLAQRVAGKGGAMVPFLDAAKAWDGGVLPDAETFVTGIGAGTTNLTNAVEFSIFP